MGVSVHVVVGLYSLFPCTSVHSIGDNSISHKGGEAIMEAMKEMTNLQHFELG